jgi:hypothetical protein
LTWVPGQVTAQLPLLHTCPATQTLPSFAPWQSPKAPQYPRSVCGLIQVPPQLICEPGQDTPHVPPLQTLPAGQTAPPLPTSPVPQPAVAPQFNRLVLGSMHVPLQLI